MGMTNSPPLPASLNDFIGLSRVSWEAHTRVAVRLLSSHVEISIDGSTSRLKGRTAVLFVQLLLAGGPVRVERLIDRLWPEASEEVGRSRLNVTMFRLRGVLGRHADVVVRSGDTVEIVVPTSWSVDVDAFRANARGTSVDRLRAYERYQHHLCSEQMAYEEWIENDRSSLAALWVHVATRLLIDNDLDPDRIAVDALRFEITDPKLVDPLVERLRAEGDHQLVSRFV